MEKKIMSYTEYRTLPEIEKIAIYAEFERYNNCLRKREQAGWRAMTDEERKWADELAEQGKARYLMNMKIGGIDERGNYTALHHRWEERK